MGQHFLSNLPAARRMVEKFGPRQGEHVLEIGPGRGVLTTLLLDAGARVTAIELDAGLAESLGQRLAGYPGFRLVAGNVLRCDLAELAEGGPARVLANLPYAITGEVLMRLFGAASALTGMMLMLQREVVNRMVAAPGGRVYGSLSVLSQYFTEPRVVMSLSPGSFTPPPAVSSSVVDMPFRALRELSPADEGRYPAFVRMIFAHRRRTLLNNLKLAGLPADEALAAAGIDGSRRPETLSRSECLALFAVCGTGRGGS